MKNFAVWCKNWDAIIGLVRLLNADLAKAASSRVTLT